MAAWRYHPRPRCGSMRSVAVTCASTSGKDFSFSPCCSPAWQCCGVFCARRPSCCCVSRTSWPRSLTSSRARSRRYGWPTRRCLLRELDPDKRRHLLERNLEDLRRLETLVANLLETSRLESGGVELQREPGRARCSRRCGRRRDRRTREVRRSRDRRRRRRGSRAERRSSGGAYGFAPICSRTRCAPSTVTAGSVFEPSRVAARSSSK